MTNSVKLMKLSMGSATALLSIARSRSTDERRAASGYSRADPGVNIERWKPETRRGTNDELDRTHPWGPAHPRRRAPGTIAGGVRAGRAVLCAWWEPALQLRLCRSAGSLGTAMGDPVECEHTDGDSGDVLQQTSTGLAFWRKSTNTPDLHRWLPSVGATSAGLLSWEGPSVDPPATARGSSGTVPARERGQPRHRADAGGPMRPRAPRPSRPAAAPPRRRSGTAPSIRHPRRIAAGRARAEPKLWPRGLVGRVERQSRIASRFQYRYHRGRAW